MSTAIDALLDTVAWELLPPSLAVDAQHASLPHATHKGVLEIGGMKLECYVLNTGQRVFAGDAIEKFFEGLRDGI